MLTDVLIALVVAGGCTATLAWRVGARGPNRLMGYLSLFLFLFMAVWAGGLWLRPIDPELWDTAWLGYLLTGLVFWLVLGIYLTRRPGSEPAVVTKTVAMGIGVFLYILFLIGIVTHYSLNPPLD